MRRLLALAALPVLAALVAGCGGSDSATLTAPATHHHRVASAAHRPFAPARPGPGWLRGARARAARVPILMYHVMTTPAPGAPNQELYVSRSRFATEVAALRRAGFHGVTLGQAWAAWTRGAPLPPHPIVLSFDDGYWSDYSHAAPILRAAGWPGVLNLELNDLLGKGSLKPWTIRRLISDGWEIDSHTITHPDLTTVDDARLRTELDGSRARLRREFGVPADFFCYPAGRFDARVIAAVRAAGYEAATTELPGAASARSVRYELPRIRVNGTDTPADVLAHVRAALAAA